MLYRINVTSVRRLNPEFLIFQKRFFAHKFEKVKKKFSHTIQLPKTKFPSGFSAGKRIQLDEFILKNCGFSGLYSWQRENINGEEFVLHDGPPYANGVPHMGHAINKVIKDIVIRSKLLSGHKIHYKPGWDCHGLPIELKAVNDDFARKLSPLEIRCKAREYAQKTILDQKVVFRSWGVMADWENKSYHTFDKTYIKNQLEQFYKLYEKGYIYRDVKPVFWSPTTRTALAEAELEYNHQHKSRSITLRFEMKNLPEIVKENKRDGNVFALVWTTTPWTIPANQAVAFNPDLQYNLIQFGREKDVYIIAEELTRSLQDKVGKRIRVLTTFKGQHLAQSSYIHPLYGSELPFLAGDYVASDVGTGLVHTAPAHGPEDFLLALSHKLNVVCLVDEKGCFMPETGDPLSGLNVLNEGTDEVIKLLQKDILNEEIIVHSYPYDWRSKSPIILRASKQWFIDTGRIKQRALEVVKDVEVIPDKFTQRLIGQMETRPYWCISRQRSWGVPIPALYDAEGTPLINKDLINHYCHLLELHGPDFWWTSSLEELIPKDLRDTLPIDGLTKGEDIIDIWFDSGLSWSAVLDNKQADLIVEGLDQFTGWFQSSLLTSVALQDKSPYRKIFVHGFALDENGNKMSKSLGNVINPQEICSGGTDLRKDPPYGVDGLRWWVAAHATHHTNILVSKSSLEDSTNSIKKIRNSLKFLLGVLNDFPENFVENPPPLSIIDQYILHSLCKFRNKVYQDYDECQFNKVCSQITYFITNQLSSFYCNITKDKLYCDKPESEARRGIQYTMYQILNVLTQTFAPIMPVLAEEVYLHHPHNIDGSKLFFQQQQTLDISRLRSQEDIDDIMEVGFKVKNEYLKEAPVNLNSSQSSCILRAGKETWSKLNELQADPTSTTSCLVDLLQTSSVSLVLDETIGDFDIKVNPSELYYCDRCRRYNSDSQDETCQRCSEIIDTLL